MIKKLSVTPTIPPLEADHHGSTVQDARAALQANKATFFFRLERELEKVNTFYLQKEAEVCLAVFALGLWASGSSLMQLVDSFNCV